jgi:hypothetical protein
VFANKIKEKKTLWLNWLAQPEEFFSNILVKKFENDSHIAYIFEPIELLNPEKFHQLNLGLVIDDFNYKESPQYQYEEFLAYPRGIVGDLILQEVINKTGDNFNIKILPTLIVLIQQIVGCPIKSVVYFEKQSNKILEDHELRSLNRTCIQCGSTIEQVDLVFCVSKCSDNATRKGSFIRMLSYDAPAHVIPDDDKSKLPFFGIVYASKEYDYYKSLSEKKKKLAYKALTQNKVHGIYDSIQIKSDAIKHYLEEHKFAESKTIRPKNKQRLFDRKFESFLVDQLQQLSKENVIITNINSEFSSWFDLHNPGAYESNKLIDERNKAWIKFHDGYWQSDKQINLSYIRFNQLPNIFKKIKDRNLRRDTLLVNQEQIKKRAQEILNERKRKKYKIPTSDSNHPWKKK